VNFLIEGTIRATRRMIVTAALIGGAVGIAVGIAVGALL